MGSIKKRDWAKKISQKKRLKDFLKKIKNTGPLKGPVKLREGPVV